MSVCGRREPQRSIEMAKITGASVFRTIFWFAVLALTSRYALMPALVREFPDISIFSKESFLGFLYLLSLAVSLKMFLSSSRRKPSTEGNEN